MPVGELVQPSMSDAEIDAAEYRRVELTGRYLPDQEVLIRSRSQNDAPGSWVVTPLRMADGTTILVNRGWIGNEGRFESVPDEMRAPTGEVDVVGLVRKTEERGTFGPKDPPTGTLTNLARVDIERVQQQVPEQLDPVYVQLQSQDPADGTRPAPVEPPTLDEGPHFSYAVQWFIFATVAIVGYPLILRRRARELELEALDDGSGDGPGDADPDAPDPHDRPGPGDPATGAGRPLRADLAAERQRPRRGARSGQPSRLADLLEPHHQHRTGRVVQHVVADRADEHPLEPAVAV